jgi:alkylation response protein AidB-like acyl-CoA dehydrogenase
MEGFTWWSDEERKFASEVEEFVAKIRPRAEEAAWRREFPWDLSNAMAKAGYFGVGVPKEYGGRGLGATGCCIATEEMSRVPVAGRIFGGSILGGLRQIIEFGTEKQKRRFLPKMAEGVLGAIAITEPFVGTDAAGIQTVAKLDGNRYIIMGKKRFIIGAGVASQYMLYARTSDDPEDIRRHKHLTGFIVEKGMPGFTIEKTNEIPGFDNTLNGYLNLDDVPVSIDNRIGQEGEGWRVMTAGLNLERAVLSAEATGWLREALSIVVPYGQRRIQFGRPTIDIPTNQFKLADLFIKLKMARLATYYTAHLLDLGQEPALESSICKVYNTDMAMEGAIEAIQLMGGDGVTKFYPLQRVFQESKVEQIAGGTNESNRIVIYRMGISTMANEFKMPRRIIHDELGVPITSASKPVKQTQVDEDKLLKVLAEDYRVNPGLYRSRDDLKEEFDSSDEELDSVMVSLEQKKLAQLHRGTAGIKLCKATYEGLKKANPPEYYRWFPSWVGTQDIF